MKNVKKISILSVISICFMWLFLGEGIAYKATSNEVKIDILSINDFHGALEDKGDTDKNLGAAKLVQAINNEKAKNPNTIVVSAGDNYTGSALSNLLLGKPINEMFANAGIKYSAVGNHEFDWGIDQIRKQAEQGIRYLAANIIDNDTGKVVDFAIPYDIQEIGGVKIGFIGLTTPETAYKTSPTTVSNLTFKNPVETAKEWVPKVREAGADIVILDTHIGAEEIDGVVSLEKDSVGLENCGADGIITGHSHKTVAGYLNGTPIVQGYYNGRAIGKLHFEFDTSTKKIIKKEASTIDGIAIKSTLQEDAATKSMVEKYIEEVKPILEEKLGSTTTGLTRDVTKLSSLGEWVSRVMLDASDAQIAVTNAGGLRDDIQPGDITMGTMYSVMPFDNVNSIWELDGADVKALFEYGFDNKINDSSSSFMQYTGVRVYYNIDKEEGNRIEKLELSDGTLVEPGKKYKVVTNDFMASGGDEYTMFAKGTLLQETLPIRDLMAQKVRDENIIDFVPENLFVLSSGEDSDKNSGTVLQNTDLPQTGGLSSYLLVLEGLGCALAGIFIRRRIKV